MERQIKITRIGEKLSCKSYDRISIEFSPDDLERIERIFKDRATNEKDYFRQGQEREMKELFREALSLWEERFASTKIEKEE